MRTITNNFLNIDIRKTQKLKELFWKKVYEKLNYLWFKISDKEKHKEIIEKISKHPNVYIKDNWNSIYYWDRSKGCKHCVKDLWCTIRITRKCNRDCFFCFTDSSPKFKEFTDSDITNLVKIFNDKLELNWWKLKSFAISGWEPFLYKNKVFNLLEYVKAKHPNLYTRIYSNWDIVVESILKKLKELGLDEIRYSIKPWEEPNYDLYKLTSKYIKNVYIEMPVIPNDLDYMIIMMNKLEYSNVKWINLVELFFNWYKIEEFKERWLKIDLDPQQIRWFTYIKPVYEYPIYWSKIVCLELIKYFAEKKSKLEVNFCAQDTKNLQYLESNKKIALKNSPKYWNINRDNWIEVLGIYDNFDKVKLILSENNFDFDTIFKEGNLYRIETNKKAFKLIKEFTSNYSIIVKDSYFENDVNFI
jgi:pyruvate formate-lyase activating enzyme-like uncharacterized protein